MEEGCLDPLWSPASTSGDIQGMSLIRHGLGEEETPEVRLQSIVDLGLFDRREGSRNDEADEASDEVNQGLRRGSCSPRRESTSA